MANYGTNSSEEGINTHSTLVAIDKDKNSQYAVKWVAENSTSSGDERQIILVHVCTPQKSQNQDFDRPSTQPDSQQLFLPYRGFCARKGIRTKEVMLYDHDIARALCTYVATFGVDTIVLGASNRSAITRAFKNADVPTNVGKIVPENCTVYVVSKGKALKMKSTSDSASVSPYFLRQGSVTASEISLSSDGSASQCTTSSTNSANNLQNYLHHSNTTTTTIPTSISNSISTLHDFATSGRDSSATSTNFSYESSSTPLSSTCSSPDNNNSDSIASSRKRFASNRMFALQQSSHFQNLRGRTLDGVSIHSSFSGSSDASEGHMYLDVSFEPALESSRSSVSSQTVEFEEELRKMKLELQQITEMYTLACQEAVNAREKVKEIAKWKSEEEIKLAESKQAQETALAILEREKQKCKAAVEIAQAAERIAQLETEKRRRAEMKFRNESDERQKAMEALARIEIRYRKYSIEEIQDATNHFDNSKMIGEGSYGPVYKARLDHTPVAIKVLRSDMAEGQKQFDREVDVLSRMRHPNMVILLGACPEYGCLVYEYMDNGCLDDRLFCKNGTPPLPWSTRFLIAAEIATALNFLHQTKPEPLVHRDLKPANILLDKNYVSKISDVGLSRLVPPSVANSVTQYHMTSAAGTFCYIDPEYQQTGMLGTKSDVYSLGIVLLQIITAKPPMGLTHHVSTAIETGRFSDILDPTVSDWPVDEALCFARLALRCCELRRRDRPDLRSEILPELERLRDVGLQRHPETEFHYRGCKSSQSSSPAVQECVSSSTKASGHSNNETNSLRSLLGKST